MSSTFPNYANISNPFFSVVTTLSLKNKGDGGWGGQ